MAEGSFTSVVSGLMPDGFVIFDFRDIVRFALGILFCGFSVSLFCFVPGGVGNLRFCLPYMRISTATYGCVNLLLLFSCNRSIAHQKYL